MIDVVGQKALITGGTGAIGEAVARTLHKLGAYVVVVGRNFSKLEQLASDLGENCEVRVCDLSEPTQSNSLLSSYTDLDILVCNAGVTKDTLAIKMTDEDFEQVINVNLKANFILNREAIKSMIKRRYGRIINISSIVGISGNPGQVNYCASKAGLIGMTKSLAYEVATRGVTVNSVAPGFIESDMTNKLNDQQREAILQKIPLKSMGKPLDIANAVAFLASRTSGYITGHTLHVNGGMLMV